MLVPFEEETLGAPGDIVVDSSAPPPWGARPVGIVEADAQFDAVMHPVVSRDRALLLLDTDLDHGAVVLQESRPGQIVQLDQIPHAGLQQLRCPGRMHGVPPEDQFGSVDHVQAPSPFVRATVVYIVDITVLHPVADAGHFQRRAIHVRKRAVSHDVAGAVELFGHDHLCNLDESQVLDHSSRITGIEQPAVFHYTVGGIRKAKRRAEELQPDEMNVR